MSDIDLGSMSEHDLLVVAVTKINMLDHKLDQLCSRADDQERRLTRLEAEHLLHMSQTDYGQHGNKKTIAMVGGAGGLIGAGITALLDYFLRR